MLLPSTTSGLLALQEAAGAELRMRLGDIFVRYRGLAFVSRNDNLFTEHWTPDVAASGYGFEGFEVRASEMVLHGVEHARGFIYRISIAFPLALIDDPAAIESHFQRQQEEARMAKELAVTSPAVSASPEAS
ncbi:MAG TPA: hypothetical protein VFT65_14765 [Candidatus Angelobacter sp.]|nr:hypothetical protein [Candidatus Angelobacter sp.]